jgi:hypothetical protein
MNSCAHRIDLTLYLLDIPQVISVTARTYSKYDLVKASMEAHSYKLTPILLSFS